MKKYTPTAMIAIIALFLADVSSIAQPGYINTFAGTGTLGYSGDGGPANLARLNYPAAVKLDNAGNLYIVDDVNHAIRKVTPDGIITTIAGTGIAGYSGDGGPATAAQLSGPESMAIDAAGNIYIADEGNIVVRKINTAGIISTFAGTGVVGFSGDGGPATAAQLADAYDVDIDGSGNVYIVDGQNMRIRKVTPSGIISTFAGTGYQGFSGDGGPATAARFKWPEGIAIDAAGNVYVADHGNHRIRKINNSGIISTFAGTGVPDGSGEGGLAISAGIKFPGSLSFDEYGNLYVSANNSKIHKINTANIITTFAGGDSTGFAGDGGTAVSARFNGPFKVAIDHDMNVYIPDFYNHRVRKVNGTPPPTAVADLTSVPGLLVFPNPTHNGITITSEVIMRDIKLTNVTGELVLVKNEVNAKSTTIDIDHLPVGAYYISVNNTYFRKIIKE